MITAPPIPFIHRKRGPKTAGQAGQGGPVLIAAGYAAGSLFLGLEFDRPIDLDGFDGSAITVNDPQAGPPHLYRGTAETHIVSPTCVRITLEVAGPSTGPVGLLNVGPGSGIVAHDTGTPWAGVTNFVLEIA